MQPHHVKAALASSLLLVIPSIRPSGAGGQRTRSWLVTVARQAIRNDLSKRTSSEPWCRGDVVCAHPPLNVLQKALEVLLLLHLARELLYRRRPREVSKRTRSYHIKTVAELSLRR